jgi:beta-galactosidase
LPAAPPRNPVIAIAPFALKESATVFANLPSRTIRATSPRPIEHYDISRGLVAYRTTLQAGPAGVLEAAKVRDLAWVYIDGKLLDTMDTRLRRFRVDIPAHAQPVIVEILLYTIARVNFGVEIHDRKGIHGPLHFRPQGGDAHAVENWEIRAIDFDADGTLPPLAWQAGRADGPAFWRGSFDAAQQGDTFLDMSGWGQGVVWVNRRCLGRYWSIGPTQTTYLPAPWIRRGRNEVIVLDLSGPQSARIEGLPAPILDQLRPERDLPQPPRTVRPRLDGVAALHEGQFAPGAVTQDVPFARARGRQFCLESLNAFDGKQFAAVGEIALLDAAGQVLDQSTWTIAYASSEEMVKEDGSALNAINGQATDHWHSAYSGKAPHPGHPHRLIIDLGKLAEAAGLRYTPRQGKDGVTGRIRQYRLYLADQLTGSD